MRPGVRLGPPDLVQQCLPRENLAAMDDEDLEQVVLRRGQGDLPSINQHPSLCEIDGERPCLKPRLSTTRRLNQATQGDSHPGQHLVHAEGLGDIVVCPQVERLDLVAFSVFD